MRWLIKKVAEKFVFLEYFLYICTINKIRIKYIRDIMINFSNDPLRELEFSNKQ